LNHRLFDSLLARGRDGQCGRVHPARGRRGARPPVRHSRNENLWFSTDKRLRHAIHAVSPAGVCWPWKKSSGTFSRHENLRFSRELCLCLWESLRLSWELRSRDRIPALCLLAVEKVLRDFFQA
jgi:hypothetical protein